MEYILGKGEVSGSLYLPDSNGINLFNFFAVSENARKIIASDQVILRLRIENKATGYVYAGASACALVALPSIQLNDEAQEANVEATIGGGATASAGGKLSRMAQWSDRDGVKQFKDLSTVYAMVEGSAGAAAEGTIKCGYVRNEAGKGVLRFSLGLKVVWGLGVKVATGFDVGLEAGAELIAHMLYLVKSHKLEGLTEEAFNVVSAYLFSRAVALGRGTAAAADGIYERFLDAPEAVRDMSDNLIGQLQRFKRNLVPGFKRLDKELTGPKQRGIALKTLMASFEPEDFEDILELLRQTRTDDDNHELKWVLRYIGGLNDKEKGIDTGVVRLMQYGSESDTHRDYQESLENFLLSRGIRWKK
jgi:hypothetical protein